MTTQNNQEGEIDRLAALQEIDCRIKEKEDEASGLLGEASSFEGELTRAREQLQQLVAEQQGLEAQRDEIEQKLDRDGNKLRDSRMRLNRVRNSTELLALQREIDLTKESNQQLEEQVLGIMTSLEALVERVTAAGAAVAALEGQFDAQVMERRQRAETLRTEMAGESGRREAVAQELDPTLRGKYEQIFQRRGGTAVVAVRQGVCLGCHMNVPPQMFNELQKFRDIRQCPNCHRILYWRPEPETVERKSASG
jgi:uncharacterized protein